MASDRTPSEALRTVAIGDPFSRSGCTVGLPRVRARHARFGAPPGGAGRSYAHRRHRCHRERGNQRARRARGRPAGRRDRRPGAPPAGLEPAQDALGGRRRRQGRAGGALPRRRRRDPPRLADPAVARRAHARGRQRHGSRRVFEAAAAAGVGALVHASSVGAYSAGPDDRAVDESWPTAGTPTSFYARHKAAAERALDAVEAAHPELRVVRLRPGLIFKREAASGSGGCSPARCCPRRSSTRSSLPVLPAAARPAAAGRARRRRGGGLPARRSPTSARPGAYNVAAEPVLDEETLGPLLGARVVEVPAAPVRAAAGLTLAGAPAADAAGLARHGPRRPADGLLADPRRARLESAQSAGEALLELCAACATRRAPRRRRSTRTPAGGSARASSPRASAAAASRPPRPRSAAARSPPGP